MRILSILVLSALMPAYAMAAPTQIVVTGDGAASAMPDMATESFTISTNASTAAAAMSDNNARYNRLASSLEALGVAPADIQTTSYNLNYSPRPQPPDIPAPGQRYGYSVDRSIDVTLHRTALVGKAIDAAAGAGVTDIGGVTFGVSDRKGQLAQALRAAVADARNQAQNLADAAGLHIVRVRQIQQNYENVPPPRPILMRAMAPSPALPTEIAPNSVQARATVTITYDAQ
jgi:uncharacterized protein